VNTHQDAVAFIWSVADRLRGDYKASEYGRVVLPFTVLRRLDCVLEPTKDAVLARAAGLPESVDGQMRDAILNGAAGYNFHNLSQYTLPKLLADPDNVAANLRNYIAGFPKGIEDIFINHFRFMEQIERLDAANLLFQIVERFCTVDLHPEAVSNHDMGLMFEELIRRFSEQSNETAGEHFTPREVIRLMVDLLFVEDNQALTGPGVIRTVYDPACGTGGMLSIAQEYLLELNANATLVAFGQELNPEAYAICRSDLLVKGQDASNIHYGNSFSDDGTAGEAFDYMLSNPPFGVEWKKVEKVVRDEAEGKGFAGRFGAGLPRVSDGSLLFVQHMISKFRKDGGTSRIAVVLNGSPLFTGGAGSGESEIRRWIIENDWLEAIVALPDQLFYNTGISTYVWIITNNKVPARKGKVQLINAADLFQKMRRSLGDKRNLIADDQRQEIIRQFGEMARNDRSRLFDNEDFGYWRITVERPLRLNFAITGERIEAVQAQSAFQNLARSKKKGAAGEAEIADGEALQQAIVDALTAATSDRVWQNRGAFVDHFRKLLKDAGLKLPATVHKAVLAGLSERDETADICTDGKGNPEPDADLRDYENVPLKDDIDAYFEREVLPHVPDAWIDGDKTKKGYEIPFNRHFYRYVPPRPLEEIDADLKQVGREIQAMLQEVIG
jgi:type I restriction enzyme M protein